MNSSESSQSPAHSTPHSARFTPWLVAVMAGLIAWLWLSPSRPSRRSTETPSERVASSTPGEFLTEDSRRAVSSGSSGATASSLAAEEVVEHKLVQFALSRRDLAQALARRAGVAVPAEVDHFFQLAEAGRWEELGTLYQTLHARRQENDGLPELARFWPAMVETIGVREAVRDWPAQALLNYGNAILEALPPGAIYLGGTDPGRFIPTLLNETTTDERHVVLTQNALADASYLDYTGFVFGDRLAALTPDDSRQAFQEYLSDAARRFAHDQQFPDEPKQVRAGENIQNENGHLQVGGQVAVMAINERLLQTLMAKNPDVPFALEESFPLASAYAQASPLGPLMQLRTGDGASSLTPERATHSIDYWRDTTQKLLADPEVADSADIRKAYAKMALAQGSLFEGNQFIAQAEQAFQIANELAPGNVEAVSRYVNLLGQQNRWAEALPWMVSALQENPDDESLRALLTQVEAQVQSKGTP